MTHHDKAVLDSFEFVTKCVAVARDRVSKINDWPETLNRDGVEVALKAATQIIDSSRQDLSTNLVTVKSVLRSIEILDDESYQLMQLEMSMGRLRRAIEDVEKSAGEAGYAGALAPNADTPQSLLPKSGFEDLVQAMDERFEDLSQQLDVLLSASKIDGSANQTGLVNFFVQQISLKIDLGEMILKLGDYFNLFELGRVIASVGRLTARFLATVNDRASRATQGLKTASQAIGERTNALVGGMKKILSRAGQAKGNHQQKFPSPPDDDSWQDWDLEATVSVVAGEPIPENRKPHLRALIFSGSSNDLFEALRERFADLSNFYNDPKIGRYKGRRLMLRDVTLLSGLTGLQGLYLDWTQVSDIRPLSGLTSLRELDLSGTQVKDVTPLSGLTGLRELQLNETQVSDVTPLSGLTSLRELVLSETQVRDVTPLSGLLNLRELYLDETNVNDVRPLSGLTSLHALHLYETRVSDVTPLSGLTSLRELVLSGTQVSDVTPLSGLKSLQLIDLYGTQVSDIRPLSSLTNLRELYLDRTQVSDIRPLSGLTSLQKLYLEGTPVRDITPLSGLTSLRELDLIGTQVSDWSSVSHVVRVKGRRGG